MTSILVRLAAPAVVAEAPVAEAPVAEVARGGGFRGPGGPGGFGGVYGGGFGGGISRGPGRNAEIVLLNEIVTRVSSGGGAMTDISNDDVGNLFKRILTGEVDRNQEFRKSLAELIVGLDPEFLQRAIIDSPEVRERLSWSVSRRIINRTMEKIDSSNLDERMAAMEVLQHIGELAVVRHKDSSLRQILGETCGSSRKKGNRSGYMSATGR